MNQTTSLGSTPARDLEALARAATTCRECFLRGEVVAPAIAIAQPRWVGARYWERSRRVVILMLNPGQSRETPAAQAFLERIRAFRDGVLSLQTVFEHQRDGMKAFGHPPGRFTRFYLDGLGLDVDRIAFANVAWCATAGNRYPRTMLARCFARHTGPLLRILQPTVVIASGRRVHRFGDEIRALVPGTTVITLFHYAHRQGRDAEHRELARVRSLLEASDST